MTNFSTTTYVGPLTTLHYKKQLIHSTKYLWHVTNNCLHVLHGTRAGSEEAAASIVLCPILWTGGCGDAYTFSAATERCPHLTADGDQCLRGWLHRGEGTAADTMSCSDDYGWLCCWDARANPRRRCSFALAVWMPTTPRAATWCCPLSSQVRWT